MAQYLIMIYEDETKWASAGKDVWNDVLNDHTAFGGEHTSALRGGSGLQPTSTATSIRRNGSGEPTVTDGPFVETKEALGGYYLIEAADLDEAIAIAKAVPARFGGVEVRPVMVFD